MTNYQRYQILSTFDIPRIDRELGEKYADLSEVCRAQSETFELLTSAERSRDFTEMTFELERVQALRATN